jgi:hypothetical protein
MTVGPYKLTNTGCNDASKVNSILNNLANAVNQLEIALNIALGVIPGSGRNGFPLLRLGVSGSDNIVRIQTSSDGGTTWIDTDSVVYMP